MLLSFLKAKDEDPTRITTVKWILVSLRLIPRGG